MLGAWQRMSCRHGRCFVLLIAAIAAALTAAIAQPALAAPPGGIFGEGLGMASPSLGPGASDGVAAWGRNSEGQLGDGGTTDSDLPVAVSGLSGVTAIAAGDDHSLALLSNGSVVAWGENLNGQLGNGSTKSSDVPVAVNGLSGVTAIAAGNEHSLALLSNGTVMGWGDDRSGQLGNGTRFTIETVPVPVSGLSGVSAIAGGYDDSLALLKNGTVMAWGTNYDGELGNGTKTESDVPVAVSGLTGVKAIATSGSTNLALLDDGTVMAWGSNEYGQLGSGVAGESDVPVAVIGLSGVIAIGGDDFTSLAVLSNGTARAWGEGDLGNGTTTGSEEPVEVTGLNGVTAISGGYDHLMALLSNGTVMSWGGNSNGELGNGNTTSSDVPVAVSGLMGATAISGGSSHSLSLGPPLATVSGIEPKAGPPPGGTPVTITGAGFSEATAVRFGSTNAASFKVESETKITAVSPPGTGTVEVTVITPGGTSATTPADTFTYGLSVSKIEPSAGPAAGGTSVTITGAAFTGATAVRFGSTNATSFKVESETSIKAVSPPGTEVVDVTVTTPAGTTATTSADRFSYAPTVTAITPKSGEESGGTSVNITGTNFTGVTAVKFGSANAASFKVESETSVTAVSPAGKYDVNVTVTTAGGTSPTSSADQFSYDGPSTCTPRESESPVVTSVEPNSGPTAGGNSVTIRGYRFYVTAPCEPPSGAIGVFNVRKVMFGSKEATSLKEESEGVVAAVAPPGSGTVHVTVETFAPSHTSAADRYTYVPAPVVTAVEPSRGPEAGGTSVTITGVNFLDGVSAVRFGGVSATSYKVDSSGEITAVAPPGSGAVDVTVTSAGGTSATSAADQFEYISPACELTRENGYPVVTGVEPGNGPSTGGTEVRITGERFYSFIVADCDVGFSVTEVMFGGKQAQFKVESEHLITAVAPPGAGTVDVTVEALGTSPLGVADHYAYDVSPPTVMTEGATAITQTTASLGGSVNPNSGEVSACEFEYGTTTAYGSIVPCMPPPGSGSSAEAISASLTGLSASTTYHFRLLATNSAGTGYSSDHSFETLANSVSPPPSPVYWFKSGVKLKQGSTVPIVYWGNAVNVSLSGGAGEVNCKTVASGNIENPSGGGTGVGETLAVDYYECKAPVCETEIAESPLGGLGYQGVGFAQAYNLPWNDELTGSSPHLEERIGAPGSGNLGAGFPEGYPARSQPPGGEGSAWGAARAIGLVTGCQIFPNPEGAPALGGVSGQPQRVASETPFEGELRPEIGGALNGAASASNPAQISFNGIASGELRDPLGPGNGGVSEGTLKYLGYATQSPVKVE